jgi:ketosteroid isomerase-like protein
MRAIRTRLCLLLFLAASSPLAAGSPSQIEKIAEQMDAARQKMMQQDATPADVDAFLAFATDDLIYEDPVVKMKIEGKDQIRKGMLGFLGASRNARIVVTKRITVASVVVFEQAVSFDEKQDDGTWKPRTRRQLTIFEFEGLKVRCIADYWSR